MAYFHSQMTRMYKESNREKVFFFYLFKKKLRITKNPGNTDFTNVTICCCCLLFGQKFISMPKRPAWFLHLLFTMENTYQY